MALLLVLAIMACTGPSFANCQKLTAATTPQGGTGAVVGRGVEWWTDHILSSRYKVKFKYEYLEGQGCRDGSLKELSGLQELEDCEAVCSATAECFAFTHNTADRKCYLKRDCINTKTSIDSRSGLKVGIKSIELASAKIPPPAPPAPPSPPPPRNLDKADAEFTMYYDMRCDVSSIDSERAASADKCQKRCASTRDCHAWSFKLPRSWCYTKEDCRRRVADSDYVSGIMPYYDLLGDGAGKLNCPRIKGMPPTCQAGPGEECPTWSKTKEESTEPRVRPGMSPYQDLLDGVRSFVTTYPENRDWATCPFIPPSVPRKLNWADECISNARKVGFLDEIKGRPNKECPAGWFLCKGMCYTLVQRNNRGPSVGPSYYADDYMSVEARCALCGGARVAFVGDDVKMQRVAAEAAAQTINEDKAVWVRRFRFLNEPNELVEDADDPYQPWHRFVVMQDHDERAATYQRYYTGEKDDLDTPQWDQRYRNQESSILCVNTLPRIRAAARTVSSRLTMEGGCFGSDKHDMWDNQDHRWFPSHNYPYPGM